MFKIDSSGNDNDQKRIKTNDLYCSGIGIPAAPVHSAMFDQNILNSHRSIVHQR